MRRKVLARTAKFVQTLVLYDGPQVVLMRSDRQLNMLAVAVEVEDLEHAFFGCEVHDHTFEKYASNKADLRYVFSEAPGGRYYLFDLCDEEDDEVRLIRAPDSDAKNEDFWPAVGFFAYCHTDPIRKTKHVASSRNVYSIDGTWDPTEFSKLYNKIADIYGFFFVTNRLSAGAGDDEKARFRRSISNRLWQGGGSYVGFYDDLSVRADTFHPLALEKIAYASPGEIVFNGNRNALADIKRTLTLFDGEHRALRESYAKINGILGREKLRRAAGPVQFSSNAMETFACNLAKEFATAMKIRNVEQLYALCGSTVLFCKVVLSFYRRAKELYTFHAEGRIKEVTAD